MERPVHSDVRALLIGDNGGKDHNPFQYAHLVKFERPNKTENRSGRASTSAQRYAYITDASRDVSWNDQSRDLNGVLNGVQKYVANKLLNVSDVQESIEAKASNFSITLDGNALGASITSGITTADVTGQVGKQWDVTFPARVDLLAAGFREGDKVLFSGTNVLSADTGTTGNFTILSFREGNVLRVKQVDPTDKLRVNTTNVTATVNLSSEEIKSILTDKTRDDYASFINREVFIYRAYFEDGKLVGETPDANGIVGPILLFKGIITGVSFDDDDSGIKITWSLSSHWGDFAQVKGRVTSDGFHRALDHNGAPNPESAIKPIYAYDKGFIHSETSINLLATYTVQVEKQKVKAKNGFLGLGIGSKVKVKKYYETEGRNTELDFQLVAKTIPVIYGVRNTGGIPVFADTLANDSSEVYVVYALCEGRIGGIYDVYIEGKSLICNDAADEAARKQQTEDEVVDVICRGRADRGDVLGGSPATNPTDNPEDYYDTLDYREVYRFGDVWSHSYHTRYRPFRPATTAAGIDNIGAGVIHGETITLTEPQDINLNFFSGYEGQEADSQLVGISKANNFKIQANYWENGEQAQADYWGPNHRLLDTAYITAKFKIKEGETTIPDIEYILRGKSLECYNYDYSYSPYVKATSESADNFILGQTVSLYRSDTNAVINSNVQIIDKWTMVRADGVRETRFRWSASPALNYNNGIPSITKFYMSANGGTTKWTMTTFNHIELEGTVQPMGGSATVSDSGGITAVTVPSDLVIGGGNGQGSPAVQLRNNDGSVLNHEVYSQSLVVGRVDGSTIYSSLSYSDTRATDI